jgi:hypothetical protein
VGILPRVRVGVWLILKTPSTKSHTVGNVRGILLSRLELSQARVIMEELVVLVKFTTV